MIDTLIANVWLSAILWALLYICDHAMTHISAKLHQPLPQERQVISYQGGMELNPVFEQEVKHLQWFSRRFILMFSFTFAIILVLGFASDKRLFEIIIGAFILEWIFVDLVHFQNFLSLRDLKTPHGATGQVEFSYWFSQRTYAYHLLSFVILYLFIALVTYRLFFVGGAISCCLLALRQFSLANRKPPSSSDTISDTTNSAKS